MPDSTERMLALTLAEMAEGLVAIARQLQLAAERLLVSANQVALIVPNLTNEELQLIAARALPGVATSRQVDFLLEDESMRVVANVLGLTAIEFQVSIENLLGPSRSYTPKRQYAMWMITERCLPQTWLFSDVAKLFNCYHGSVVSARKRVSRLIGQDADLAGALDSIVDRAQAAAR